MRDLNLETIKSFQCVTYVLALSFVESRVFERFLVLDSHNNVENTFF